MGLLNIDPGLIIWTIFIFLILLVLLRRFAWKPILAMIDERESAIQDSLERAEQAQAEAEERLQQYEQRLAEARREAREILNESRESGEKIRDEIVSEAQSQKQKMIEDAREQIEAEREKTVRELRDTVADVAISAASRILNRELSPEKHAEIIEQSLEQFKERVG